MPESDLRPACLRVDADLETYVDGELAPAEAAAAAAHIADCEHCARSLELTLEIRDALPRLAVDCPRSVESRILKQTLARPVAIPRRRLIGYRLAIAAGVAGLVVLAVLLVQSRQPRSPSTVEVAAAEAQIRQALAVVSEISQRSAAVALEDVLAARVVGTVRRVAAEVDRSLPNRQRDQEVTP